MLYAAMTFWLVTAVLSAWGVQQLWRGMVAPRVVNAVLLPGTLVAQLGHVLGLLITGATVNNATLYKRDESGEPATTRDPKPHIPLLGPALIALLPLVACAAAFLALTHFLGGRVAAGLSAAGLARSLPTSVAGVWNLLRDQVSLVESLVNTIRTAPLGHWQTWLFAYLAVCLTVRLSPFPGSLRATLGAVLGLGAAVAAVGAFTDAAAAAVDRWWLARPDENPIP